MIKFNEEPRLNDKEKEYVLKYLKPLLKQNKIAEARERVLTDIGISITDKESTNIISFLLFHLQNNYFKGSDKIFNDEFCYLKGLCSLDIPNWITEIEQRAFYRCENLVNVEIPDSVVSIGGWAFRRCSLNRVSISKNCELSVYAFNNGVEIIRR